MKAQAIKQIKMPNIRIKSQASTLGDEEFERLRALMVEDLKKPHNLEVFKRLANK